MTLHRKRFALYNQGTIHDTLNLEHPFGRLRGGNSKDNILGSCIVPQPLDACEALAVRAHIRLYEEEIQR